MAARACCSSTNAPRPGPASSPQGHRTVHTGLAGVLLLVENFPPALAFRFNVEPYAAEQFTDDIMRLSGGRSDVWLVL